MTTAFFNVLLDEFDCSYPGGGYQPFQALPDKRDVTCYSSGLKKTLERSGVR